MATKKRITKNVENKIVKKTAKPKRSLLKRVTQPEAQTTDIDPFATIRYVVMTEKAIQLIEKQNKIMFVVDRRATKGTIKQAVESAFSTKVRKVQTMIDQSGRKRASIRFVKEGDAGEIAIRLGII